MTTTLDQILAHMSPPAGVPCAWVLFVHPEIPWRLVLLFRHSDEPHVWGLPGGPIFDGETPEAAAQRWAEAQTGMACGTFSQSFDVTGGRVFVAPVDGMTRLEVEKACNGETFWMDHDTVLTSFSPTGDPTPYEMASYERSIRAGITVPAPTRRTPPIHPVARAALERVDDLILQPLTEEDTMATRSEFIAAQAKADRVAHAYGDAAPAPMTGETLMAYRARLASVYQKFSRSFKDSDLHRIGDPSAMSGIEDTIYNDAMTEARHPTAASLRPGELRAVKTPDASGRMITKYFGESSACWDQFNPPIRYVTKIMTGGR